MKNLVVLLSLVASTAQAGDVFEKFYGDYKLVSASCYARQKLDVSTECPKGALYPKAKLKGEINHKGLPYTDLVLSRENYAQVTSLDHDTDDEKRYSRVFEIAGTAIYQRYLIYPYITRWEEIQISSLGNGRIKISREYHELPEGNLGVDARIVYILKK